MSNYNYLLGSHNSWSYLKPKKWWMKLLSFTARCQSKSILEQYYRGVRCFDLRLRFNGLTPVITHGIIRYDYGVYDLLTDLFLLNSSTITKVYVRVCFDVRRMQDYRENEAYAFKNFCSELEQNYPRIIFFGGDNLLPANTKFKEYHFKSSGPTCEEKYASVCPPRILDDWFPWLYAKIHNKKNLLRGTDKEILMIDFIE